MGRETNGAGLLIGTPDLLDFNEVEHQWGRLPAWGRHHIVGAGHRATRKSCGEEGFLLGGFTKGHATSVSIDAG